MTPIDIAILANFASLIWFARKAYVLVGKLYKHMNIRLLRVCK